MPTVAEPASYRNTQAVGAVLLHQFAKDRLQRANIDGADELLRKAETDGELKQLAADLLHDEIGINFDSTGDDTTISTTLNDDSNQSLTTTTTTETNSEPTSCAATNGSTIQQCSFNNTTMNSERYASIMSEQTTISNEDTVYHSIDKGNLRDKTNESVVDNIFDRVQNSSVMRKHGQMLRSVAEEFEKHRLREKVRKQAEGFNLTYMTQENFKQLLEELFESGVTREKICILFFFSTDVAIKAASSFPDFVVQLLQWAFSYIINTFCKFIYDLGGWTIALSSEKWDDILFRQLPSALVSCVAVLSILSLMNYLHKSLRV